MSDSEDSSEVSDDFEPFDESERSDDENKLLDKNYEKNHCFKINGNLIHKNKLTNLVKSSNPKDVKYLNALVTKMVEDDNRRAFRYLLEHGYKVDVLNDEGQTAVHLIFYDECQRVLRRHSLKDLTQKKTIFGVPPKIMEFDMMMRHATQSLFSETHKNLGPGDLIYTMIQVWLIVKPLDLNYTDCYGLTYLHIACFAGEKLLVNKCIEAGVDVNRQFCHPDVQYKNYTALHFAVINHMIDTSNIVRILLKHGADVHAKDSLGRTPLHLACRFYHCPFDFRIIDEKNKNMDSDNLAVIIVESPESFYTKSSRFVHTFLKHHSDVNARDNLGNTPLLSIFPETYHEISRFTLDWHKFSVPIRETTTKFAYLVNAGADVTAKNENGDTILHLITRNLKAYRDSSNYTDAEFDDSCHTEMIRKVLKLNPKIDVNIANNLGQTPLQMAVDCMSSGVVKLLMNHGADLSSLKYKEKLFYFPNIVPNYHAVRNIVDITESFKTAGFYLTRKANIQILKFLLHETDDCECVTKDYRHYGIAFGSNSHSESILNRCFGLAIDDTDLEYALLMLYVKIIEEYNLYIDGEVHNLIEVLTDAADIGLEDLVGESQFAKIQAEFETIQTLVFDDNTPLYNIIANHPYNIPERIFKNFYSKQMENFPYFSSVILGHMTKAILKYYVVKSSGSLIKMLCPFLPEPCCQIIGEHLSNESILNVCLAVDIEEDYEDYLLTS